MNSDRSVIIENIQNAQTPKRMKFVVATTKLFSISKHIGN